MVSSLTGKKTEELCLPHRAIITFRNGDTKRIAEARTLLPNKSWLPYRSLLGADNCPTIITTCPVGGPNIAVLVEELAAFGVEEMMLWGYCGAIHRNIRIGDVIVARKALREEGTSYHYSPDSDDFLECNWPAGDRGISKRASLFLEGDVWTCDALYRETREKVKRHEERGILAIDMETASFYAVCRSCGVRGIAFLVVSDTLYGGVWKNGFRSKPFKTGVRRVLDVMLENID